MPHARLLVAIFLLPIATAHSQSIATNSPTPLSTRVNAYRIDATLDTAQKTLDATESITYKNLTGLPLSTFPFHLYLNAFRPQSSFTSETHFTGGIRDNEGEDDYPREKEGSITISKITADNFGDLTPTLHFTAPDDGNTEDHTVAEINLPHPLPPGASITFHIAFHDKFPLSVARNGWKRDFIMGGQWYPKPGVFWHGAWNCHQYHSTTEFFSDFATFDVHLTLPRNYIVGASGVPTGETLNPAGSGHPATRTLSFYGEDIGDFAFAASPHFRITDATFLSSMGPVKVHVLALASHPQAGARYRDIILKTLAQFDHRYGPYPYKIVTVIDPEPGSEMEGMEYPTLFTGGTSWYDPSYTTELTAEHEFGHQYWYGMVATNEFEDAWLDEGINSYTEVKVLDAILGRDTSMLRRSYVSVGDYELQRLGYTATPDYDPVTRFAWQFRNAESYGAVTYGKTATLLATLEGIIGTDTMDEAMRTYFMRFRFTHPTTEDFLRTIELVAIAHRKAVAVAPATHPTVLNQTAGAHSDSAAQSWPTNPYSADPVPRTPIQELFTSAPPVNPTGHPDYSAIPPLNSSLRPYINQAIYGTQVLDYAVDSVSSSPAIWWKPEPKDNKQAQFRDIVYLHRKGDFILPVTLQITFEDGTKTREFWNGIDRWTSFTYIKNTRIRSAEIDPDHTVLLDRDLFNNSYTTETKGLPAGKLTNMWLTFLQLASQISTWIV